MVRVDFTLGGNVSYCFIQVVTVFEIGEGESYFLNKSSNNGGMVGRLKGLLRMLIGSCDGPSLSE